MPLRPKVFFDTSLCIDIARECVSGKMTGSLHSMCSSCRYFISPLTVYELVAGLTSGTDAHFEQNREAIKALYPVGHKRFLPSLRVFLPKQLFGERVKVSHSFDMDFDLWVRAVLKARSRRELESGRMKVGLKGRKGFGLLLNEIDKQMRCIEDGLAGLLTAFRKTGAPTLTPEIWAKLILDILGKQCSSENISLVLERLNAAYHFDVRLWEFIEGSNYNFAKHRSELVDANQLSYLCDPEMYLATSDLRLKKAVAGSTQSTRVLNYDELKKIVPV